MAGQIKTGLGALRKSVAGIADKGQSKSSIMRMVEDCLKDPDTALEKFSRYMDERRRELSMGPGEGFIRIEVDGQLVILTAEEAQMFIDEAASGPAQERRTAAKMKRLLTCKPEELYAESTFIRMLVEATMERFREEVEGDESDEGKEFSALIDSVDTRFRRRLTVMDNDHQTLETVENHIGKQRKALGIIAFEDTLKQIQTARAANNRVELQRLTAYIQGARNQYERAIKSISPEMRTSKIARRDIQVHVSVFMRYLEALLHRQKTALVSSVENLRESVESGGGASPEDLAAQEEQLENIERQEAFASKQADEADAVIAAVNAAENLPVSNVEADVDDLVRKAESKRMLKQPESAPQTPQPETKAKTEGMHVRKD